MKLRWTIEGKHSATFTSSKNVKTKEEADKTVVSLKMQNGHEGYVKNSRFILYDDNNNPVIKYQP